MKRITPIILAVAAILTGSVSCRKDNVTDKYPLPTVALSIIPDFSDGSVYSFSDDGSFFLKVTVTPKAYIEKLTNTDSFICKADFRSVITKATLENPDFTVVGKIASASVEEGYMTVSFTLTEEEMGKMREAGHMVSLSIEDADGTHGASTPFVSVARYTRDGSGGDIVDFNGHKAVRLAGAYWATENACDTAKIFYSVHDPGYGDYFNQCTRGTDEYDANDNNARNVARSWGGEWTLPDKEQWQDLLDYCKWTYTEIDRKRGWLVEGKSQYGEEGNCIFLPCNGMYRTSKFSEQGYAGYYWASGENCCFYMINLWSTLSTSRLNNFLSVRPVYDKAENVIFGVSIDPRYTNINWSESETLTARVRPYSAIDKSIVWSSSNPDVASVDEQGKVTAISVGKATITAEHGGFTATCDVTVVVPRTKAVDLGLSVKWANMNLGAYAPEMSGDYYAWGATAPNPGGDYSWAKCPYCSEGYGEKFSKYVPMGKMSYWGGGGSPDNKRKLEPGDDAAVAKLGGKWRTPTSAEFEELFKSCDTEWTMVNNVNGLKFTSRTNGNSIFLPATGHRDGKNLIDAGEEGLYMSSSLATDIPDHAMSFEIKIRSEYASTIAKKRNMGLTIRAVTE